MGEKIGILTYHAAHNYGSMLQAYALQTYLEHQGFNPQIINLRIKAQKKAYNNPLGKIGGRTIKRMLLSPKKLYNEWGKWKKFESFLHQKLKLSAKEFHVWDEVLEYINKSNFYAIICGSDQIWNMTCVDYNEAYFLPANLNKTKKIAYAPSFGGFIDRFKDDTSAFFIKKNALVFDSLSVREKSGADFLSSLLNCKIPVVPDPTLLLTTKDYESLITDTPVIQGDYVLYYTPWHVEKAENIALQIGKKYGCPVIMTNGNNQTNRHILQKNNIGPIDFLNAIKYAKVVCGLSFHLVVFSLLFEKEFFSIDGDRDNRLKTLLNSMGLNDRAISLDETFEGAGEKIDYSQIAPKIAMLRQFGIDYLYNSLK